MGLVENMLRKWLGYDMALSEHAVYAPKRFTISPGLTNTEVRILEDQNLPTCRKL